MKERGLRFPRAFALPRRELFEGLDTDKSGGIDMKEFTDGLKQQGYSLSSEEIEQIMDRIDINADKLIVFDELAASLLDWKAVSQDHIPCLCQMVALPLGLQAVEGPCPFAAQCSALAERI